MALFHGFYIFDNAPLILFIFLRVKNRLRDAQCKLDWIYKGVLSQGNSLVIITYWKSFFKKYMVKNIYIAGNNTKKKNSPLLAPSNLFLLHDSCYH